MIKVTVILVHFGDLSNTIECLNSLVHLIVSDGIQLSQLVVNNSLDKEVENKIIAMFPMVTVITPLTNLGFAEGNNTGIRHAMESGSSYIWLVNNDTILDTKALSILEPIGKDVGVIGSKIYFAPGTEYHYSRYLSKDRGRVIWYAGGKIDWNNMYASHRGVDEVDNGSYNRLEETDYVTGCSMLLSTEMLRKIGLFDFRYFLYLEDLDLCVRASKAGYKILYNPSSILWHKNGSSSGKPGSDIHIYYQVRNRILFTNSYAILRTKFAIFRESWRKILYGSNVEKIAIFDAYIGRYGQKS